MIRNIKGFFSKRMGGPLPENEFLSRKSEKNLPKLFSAYFMGSRKNCIYRQKSIAGANPSTVPIMRGLIFQGAKYPRCKYPKCQFCQCKKLV